MLEQERLDQSIRELTPQVKNFENELTELLRTESPSLEEETFKASRFLDAQWDHHTDSLTVVGKYFSPRPLFEQFQQKSFSLQLQEGIQTGINQGFYRVHDRQNERIRLGLYLEMGRAAVQVPGYNLQGHAYAVAPLENTSFTLVRSSSKERDTSYDPDYSSTLINTALKQYDEHILNPSSSFYHHANPKRQLATLESISNIPNEEMPSESSEEILRIQGQFPYIYFLEGPGQKPQKMQRKDRQDIFIDGHVCGFTALECIGPKAPKVFKSPDDLLDPGTGIVAGVEVWQSNSDLKTGTSLYYVPYRYGTNIELDTVRK